MTEIIYNYSKPSKAILKHTHTQSLYLKYYQNLSVKLLPSPELVCVSHLGVSVFPQAILASVAVTETIST